MNEKQDRQGVRTATDLERKYQFDKRFAEIMGIALDSQKSITELGSDLRSEMLEQTTSITRDTESIIMSALESYVETSDYESFKETVSSELRLMADNMTVSFTNATNRIDAVNGDLQSQINTITKYFTFSVDGLTIGQLDNPNKVVIDNDEIIIQVNNTPVQHFKADGTALVPTLKVTDALNLFGLYFTQDSTNINCDYNGGGL